MTLEDIDNKLNLEFSLFWRDKVYRVSWLSLSAAFGIRNFLDSDLIRDQFWGNWETLPHRIRSFFQMCLKSKPFNTRLLMRFLAVEIINHLEDEEFGEKYPLILEVGSILPQEKPSLEDSKELEAIAGQIAYLWGAFAHREDWDGIAQLHSLNEHLDSDLPRHQYYGDWYELSDDIFVFLMRCLENDLENTKRMIHYLANELISSHESHPLFELYRNVFGLLFDYTNETIPIISPTQSYKEIVSSWLSKTDRQPPNHKDPDETKIIESDSVEVDDGETMSSQQEVQESLAESSLVSTEETNETLLELNEHFQKVSQLKGQARGYAFEKFIHTLFDQEELAHKSSYRPTGEQIDGTVMVGKVFLIETKWEDNPIPASEVYAFQGKVRRKFEGTSGIFWSMSGYSEEAIPLIEREQNVLLFDESDMYGILKGEISFTSLCREKHLRATSHGELYFPWSKMRDYKY